VSRRWHHLGEHGIRESHLAILRSILGWILYFYSCFNRPHDQANLCTVTTHACHLFIDLVARSAAWGNE
jgi:hypothetical protein